MGNRRNLTLDSDDDGSRFVAVFGSMAFFYMKRLLVFCLASVCVVSFCRADEPVLTPELEEVASITNACPCSKSCRCDESCRCRITGCCGCCDQYKNERDTTKGDAGMCVAAYCDCVPECRCDCGCSGNKGGGCCS